MNSTVTAVESFRFLGTTQDLKWDYHIESMMKKAQQRLYFLHQLRTFNLPQDLLIQFYSAIIESVLCTSITVWFSSATKSDLRRLVSPDCWANHWYNPPHSSRTVLIQSEQKGWQNHSGPLTSNTLPVWTVTIWSTLQSSEHQNDQTQKLFLSPSNPSHEHLTLNMEHTTLLYNYLFTTHTYFLISNVHMSDLTHNCLYCILCLHICILFFYYLCPVLSLSVCCTMELMSL